MKTLSNLFDDFKTSSTFLSMKPSTQHDYQYKMQRFIRHATNVEASKITTQVAQRLCDEFVRDCGICTAHHIRRVVSALYNHHLRLGNVSDNPFSVVRLPQEKDREVVWDLADVEFLYELATNRHPEYGLSVLESCACAIGYVAYASAQRISQIMNLRLSEVVDGKLRLKQSKRSAWVYVPLIDKAIDAIGKRDCGEFVFGEWTPQSLAKAFARVRHKTGLDNSYQLRDLRRTRLVEMFDKGCTDAEAMSWSGHANADSLKPYRQLWGRETSPVADNAFAKLNGG